MEFLPLRCWTKEGIASYGYLKKNNITRTYFGDGIVGVELEGILFLSCYFSPNRVIDDFEAYLNELERIIKTNKSVVLGGDLNAKSGICGSKVTDKRGEYLEELILCNNLSCANDKKSTFSNANGDSLIDITLISGSIALSIFEWMVHDEKDSGSCHHYITFNITKRTALPAGDINTRLGWILTPSGGKCVSEDLKNKFLLDTPEDAQSLVNGIKISNDKYLKKKNDRNKHRPVYWWSKKIAALRKECHKHRRSLTRARAKQTDNEQLHVLHESFKQARKQLKQKIMQEKKAAGESYVLNWMTMFGARPIRS